ncbi:hypothetical protein [Silanimonas sp.]|uniref:hypothetical protein n=1 Tax=Silanimonas sp. TaxID=1929290 RepID=UPI001BB8A001|nr:hypothetical protein [Silanimonas sp.]MBS3896660.1 hypothetical protein [Silanimonas sp.]
MAHTPLVPLAPVAVHEISLRGRIDPRSSWHDAERWVAVLAGPTAGASPWASLVQALGGNLDLARRRASELQPTIDAVNRIIAALNQLPAQAGYADLQAALGLGTPAVKTEPPAHDHIGEAMNRVRDALESRRAGPREPSAFG